MRPSVQQPKSRKTNMLWARTWKYYLKKQLFDRGGQRSRSHEGHYCTRNTTLWSCTHIPNKYYLKNNYLTYQVKSPTKVTYSMWHTALWSSTHIPIKYYLFDNYLTLRSKVKVPRRSLRYATHRLMVMHPHTKYHWPISKDKMLWPGQENTI